MTQTEPSRSCIESRVAHPVGFLEEETLDIFPEMNVFLRPTEIYSGSLRNLSILSSGRFTLDSESEGRQLNAIIISLGDAFLLRVFGS